MRWSESANGSRREPTDRWRTALGLIASISFLAAGCALPPHVEPVDGETATLYFGAQLRPMLNAEASLRFESPKCSVLFNPRRVLAATVTSADGAAVTQEALTVDNANDLLLGRMSEMRRAVVRAGEPLVAQVKYQSQGVYGAQATCVVHLSFAPRPGREYIIHYGAGPKQQALLGKRSTCQVVTLEVLREGASRYLGPVDGLEYPNREYCGLFSLGW